MSKKEKSDFFENICRCGSEDPLKGIDLITNARAHLAEDIKSLDSITTALGSHIEYIPPGSFKGMPVTELREVNIEMASKLDTIISKIDALNEKPDVLKVLLDLGMSLTVLENAGIETPCLTFEGVNTYIKLTIAQYHTLKACGVPDLI